MNRKAFLDALHRVASHPALNLASGLILLFTGLIESLTVIFEDLYHVPIGMHHGIMLFGFLQMVKALPDVMKGIRFIDDGERALLAPSKAAAR